MTVNCFMNINIKTSTSWDFTSFLCGFEMEKKERKHVEGRRLSNKTRDNNA